MDAARWGTYIAPAMKRVFLALVALIMGVLAQAGPAQARPCASSNTEIGALVHQQAGTRRLVPASLPVPREWQFAPRLCRAACRFVPLHPMAVTSVRPGIDRARE